MKSVIVSAALLGGLFSVSSFANVVAPLSAPAPARFAKPVPSEVVNPAGLSRRHEGETVQLSLTIDEAGRPHDIKILSPKDQNLSRSLLPAVAQWKFTPAMQNGAPVATKVVLPVQLVDGPVS
jgi:TonB family protein